MINDENAKRIIDACPSLFASMRHEEDGATILPIHFGFECGNGWTDLLVELCERIQKQLNTMPKDIAEEFVAIQVKEKYGTLRFYLSHYDETVESFISEAEKKSSTVCQECGKQGKLRGKVWYYTACDEHTRPCDLEDANCEKLP